MSNISVILCGIFSIAFGVFHLFFLRIFGWSRTLLRLNFANRGILQVLNFQLAFVFLTVGVGCILFATQIQNTAEGKYFLLANSIFWLIRSINQIIFFRRNHWFIHLLTVFFLLGTVLFLIPVLMNHE